MIQTGVDGSRLCGRGDLDGAQGVRGAPFNAVTQRQGTGRSRKTWSHGAALIPRRETEPCWVAHRPDQPKSCQMDRIMRFSCHVVALEWSVAWWSLSPKADPSHVA